jgi:predicted glutamine amidotransferase
MGYVSRNSTTLPEFIGRDFQEFCELSRIHRDGWGLATTTSGKSTVAKTILPAAEDEYFSTLINSQKSCGAILHFRWATPGLEINQDNSHPFSHGGISMIHNGTISPHEALLPLVNPDLLQLRVGTTDSEVFFLYVLSQISDHGFLPGVKAAIQRVKSEYDYSSINCMIINEDYFIVVSEHDPKRKPDWADDHYYELRFRTSEDGIAVASSGWNQSNWDLLPNHSMLIYDRNSFAYSVSSL